MMKVLIDTYIALWTLVDDTKMPLNIMIPLTVF